MGKRSYAVIGMGGVGGFYGAKLAAAGHDVHFIVRSNAERLRAGGLHLESVDGDIDLPDISVHTSVDDVAHVDTVLVAVKTTDTAGAIPAARALAARGSTVVVMQNGLGVEAAMAAEVGDAPVLGAMCFICSNQVAPGRIRHLDYGRVTVGAHGTGRSRLVDALVDDLCAAGVAASGLADLASGRWKKLVWNIPYNGLSVVLDAGTDELMADPQTYSLVRSLMEEVVTAAGRCGADVPRAFVQQMLDDTEKMTPYATSMKLDFDAGRALEIEAIYAAPLAAARAAGYEMVRVEMLYQQLRFLDERSRRR